MPRSMEMFFNLRRELDFHVRCDRIELEKLVFYTDGREWDRTKPSQRIIDILLERYKDGSEVTRLMEEVVSLDSLEKVDEWGSCENRLVKLETWKMECLHYCHEMEHTSGVHNLEWPRLLPLWVGEAKAAKTMILAKSASGWWK